MKKLVVVVAVVFALVAVVLAVALSRLESTLNENRDWVSDKISAALGRQVRFGEVGISILGGLGVRVTDLVIADDPAFSKEPFVTADAIDLGVSLLPALFGRIEVGHVVLRSPRIHLVQTARGLSTSTLGAGGNEKAAEQPEATGAAPLAFFVARVEVSDGALRFVDRTAQPPAETAIEQLDFEASSISLDGTIPFELEAAILGAPRQNVRIVGQVENPKDPKVDFTLTSDALELGKAEGDAAPPTLRALEVRGSLSVPKTGPKAELEARSGKGSFAGADYRDLTAALRLQDQVATIQKLSASAFDGEIGVTGRYDMRNPKRPRFDLQTKLASMRLEQILASRAPASAQKMRGELGGTLALAGAGSSWEQIKPTLTGRGNVLLVDGVLHDVNLAETALQGITGVPGLSGLLPPSLRSRYPEVFGAEDTVFENMDAKLDIGDSQVKLRDFRLAARDYALAGEGRYHLDNRLDLSTVMTFSQQLSDDLVKAADPVAYLRSPEGRVAFPVKLVGPPPDIRTVPDVAYIAKAASREAAGRLIDRALGTQKQEPTAEGEEAPPTAGDAASELLKKGLGELLR